MNNSMLFLFFLKLLLRECKQEQQLVLIIRLALYHLKPNIWETLAINFDYCMSERVNVKFDSNLPFFEPFQWCVWKIPAGLFVLINASLALAADVWAAAIYNTPSQTFGTQPLCVFIIFVHMQYVTVMSTCVDSCFHAQKPGGNAPSQPCFCVSDHRVLLFGSRGS